MIFELHPVEANGSSDERHRSAQLVSDPVLRGKVIDFEIARRALDLTPKPERQSPVGAEEPSPLPNLASEDWFDWAALCALFGAVALFSFLAAVLFR